VAGRLHHAAICVRDMEASLRFWRDGIGLDVLMDQAFEGDWPGLFDAPSRRLRSVFLGDPAAPDAGIVELVAFEGDVSGSPPPGAPSVGFFLLSLFVDVDTVLERLGSLGLAAGVRRISQPGPGGSVAMATVRDPDGVLVELIGR
jgi:catechol 2,3-dioxygenase-like lactoylglutathione lyase family enzyme